MSATKDNDLFGIPDELNIPSKNTKKKTDRKTTTKQTTLSTSSGKPPKAGASIAAVSTSPLPGQGFLPGLSRRGRPRLTTPISAVERTAEHRRKRIANGAKRVEIILDSDVSKALDRLAEHHQEPKSDVIATLIRKAATRLKG
jgi:hypothetical protein